MDEIGSDTRRRLVYACGAATALSLYLWQCSRFVGYVNDDAFITFRYSRFLALGRGPYFNVGEHVEGYTNFLPMLAMAPVLRLLGAAAALPVAKIVGVASGLLCLVLLVRLAPRLLRREDGTADSRQSVLPGLVAAGLVAASPSFALNSVSGLETSLFACLVTAGVLLGSAGGGRGLARGSGLAFAGAALTRPEGAYVFAAFAVALIAMHAGRWLRMTRRDGIRAAWSGDPILRSVALDTALVGAAVAAQLTFRWFAYDGEWLPNTYLAKSGGFFGVTPAQYVRRGAVEPLLGPIAFVVGWVGFLGFGPGLRRATPVAAAALAGMTVPFVAGTDWMPGWRLVVPFLPLTAVVVAGGWWALGRALIRRTVWVVPLLMVLSVPTAWLLARADGEAMRESIVTRARGYRDGHQALADWLEAESAHGDTIALMDIGIVGYRCIDRRILDLSGLTDRTIAESPGGFLVKQYDPSYVFERRPEFIVLVFTGAPGRFGSASGIAGLQPWTPMEARIASDPRFRGYLGPRSAGTAGEDWRITLARELGAARVFNHDYPGAAYFLAAFRRQAPG